MKNSHLLLFFVFISSASYAQQSAYSKVPITRDTAYQWSARSEKVINLTPGTGGLSLKKWILSKIRKEGVTAYTINNDGRSNSSYKFYQPSLVTQDWLKGLGIEIAPTKNLKEWYFFDKNLPKENYERYLYRIGDKNISADSCCGCDEADAFRTQQLLNYKNGKFSISNIFISPLCARRTGENLMSWYPLCNVAYNEKADRKFPGKSADVVLLNTDAVDYDFNQEYPSPLDSVLTRYQTDIGSLIYQDLLKGNLRGVDLQTGKPVAVKNLLTIYMSADTMAVYSDDDQKVSSYKVLQQERSPAQFSHLRITQDLYFDLKNERLYSIVRSVIILLPIRSYNGSLLGYMPFCRLE